MPSPKARITTARHFVGELGQSNEQLLLPTGNIGDDNQIYYLALDLTSAGFRHHDFYKGLVVNVTI